jgi:hypothetical protein
MAKYETTEDILAKVNFEKRAIKIEASIKRAEIRIEKMKEKVKRLRNTSDLISNLADAQKAKAEAFLISNEKMERCIFIMLDQGLNAEYISKNLDEPIDYVLSVQQKFKQDN